ncbi:hypothetical protein ACFL1A_02575 [Patescibacteria group bacterium]
MKRNIFLSGFWLVCGGVFFALLIMGSLGIPIVLSQTYPYLWLIIGLVAGIASAIGAYIIERRTKEHKARLIMGYFGIMITGAGILSWLNVLFLSQTAPWLFLIVAGIGLLFYWVSKK